MTAFCVSGEFHCHPKVIGLLDARGGAKALNLWLLAGSWCAGYSQTGMVPFGVARRIGPKAAAETLVRCGLWTSHDDGYRFVDDGLWKIDEPRSGLPRRAVFERDGWRCVYCGAAITMQSGHCDHVHPRSRGGSDEMENLAAACARCNLNKGAKTPEEWKN